MLYLFKYFDQKLDNFLSSIPPYCILPTATKKSKKKKKNTEKFISKLL